ncbi:MAG: nucleotidyltransferase family protein [Clostridia bacterium]|nr:nucleotidyltransferase family protein [Clostridia bacterium]
MKKPIVLLFELIANVIDNRALSEEDIKALKDDDILKKTLKLATFHDLSHLVSKALLDNNIINEKDTELYNSANNNVMLAIYRYEQLAFTTKKVYALLEENNIPYLPMKGEVIREVYPEKWMRNSCDTDIFINKKDIDKAIKLIADNLGGKVSWLGNHDVPIYFDNDTHIELHFSFDDLKEVCGTNVDDDLETCFIASENGKKLIMPEELFYFHHIAHMVKHIKYGGCGIRPFLDLYLLLKSGIKKDRKLLEKYSLLTFADYAEKVSLSWFGDKPIDDSLKPFTIFIIRGGAYGVDINSPRSRDNLISKDTAKRIILPYNELKYIYKPLAKHKVLYPVFSVVRIFNLAFVTAPKLFIRKKRVNNHNKNSKTEQMLKKIGL